jgi:Tfp pilus assembly protein PilO
VSRRWRERVKLPLLALLVLNLGVYVAFTMPRSMRERSAAARATVLREEIERDRRVTSALRARSETLRTNREDLDRFYARLGRKDTLAQVRAEITALAADLGLRVGGLTYSPEAVKGGEGVARLEMKLPVSGTYRALVAFLDRMERSAHFVTVDQIQLRKRDTGPEGGLDIALSTFYRTAPAAADEEEAP